MGYHSSMSLSFLLTFFNVRLGVWVGNRVMPGGASPGGTTWHRLLAGHTRPRVRYSLSGPSFPNCSGLLMMKAPTLTSRMAAISRIWHYLRSHWLANSVFSSLADIMDACEMAWNRFATNHGLIRSLCAVPWTPASPAL